METITRKSRTVPADPDSPTEAILDALILLDGFPDLECDGESLGCRMAAMDRIGDIREVLTAGIDIREPEDKLVADTLEELHRVHTKILDLAAHLKQTPKPQSHGVKRACQKRQDRKQ